jgi:hypothetical protein
VKEDYVECPELSGKTIQTLRISKNTGGEAEIHLDLTDGTSFSCFFRRQPEIEAALYQGGVGTPKIIREYEI